MDANKLREILYAYSAGCLDREEYADLFEYINSGSAEMDKEASELQKVITLIPAIVDIEMPSPRVKDKVARKLYRMKGEEKARKEPLVYSAPPTELPSGPAPEQSAPEDDGREQPAPEYTPAAEAFPAENLESKELVNEVHFADLNEPAAETAANDELPAAAPQIRQAPKPYIPETEESEVPRKTKGSGSWVSFVTGVVLTVLISAAVFYLLNEEIKKDRSEIAALSGQVKALTDDLGRLEMNQRVQDIQRARDINHYNLDGIESNKMGSGELYLSVERKAGVLQLYNMPPLAGPQIYQLWVSVKDTTLPMGVYQTRGEINSFLVDQIPPALTLDQITAFKVTLENNPEGSQTPSANTVLIKVVSSLAAKAK